MGNPGSIMLKSATDYSNSKSLGFRFRAKRAEYIRSIIDSIDYMPIKILDIGGTELYWNVLGAEYLIKRGVKITLVNITAEKVTNKKIFESLIGNGTNLSDIDDRSYDLAHSNSVIEHVGRWADMKAFAAETRRVGKSYYVQTPSFWFPMEPHFLTPFYNWLPYTVRRNLILKKRRGHIAKASNLDDAMTKVESAYLLDRKNFEWLFRDAEIKLEKFMGITKSFVAIKHDRN